MSDQDLFTGTQPVAPGRGFDIGKLQAFMEQHVAGFTGTLDVREFKGGQSNPTYSLTAGGKRYVMRRKPPGQLLKSARQRRARTSDIFTYRSDRPAYLRLNSISSTRPQRMGR